MSEHALETEPRSTHFWASKRKRNVDDYFVHVYPVRNELELATVEIIWLY